MGPTKETSFSMTVPPSSESRRKRSGTDPGEIGARDRHDYQPLCGSSRWSITRAAFSLTPEPARFAARWVWESSLF